MASDREFVQYLCDQLDALGDIRFRKMFGEYALYRGDKVVALVCDNRLFVKPTSGGRAGIGRVVEAPPYPGARPYFLIEDRLDDQEWLTELIRITDRELPAPRPKVKR